jgi:CRP-like cAMP-binding protein
MQNQTSEFSPFLSYASKYIDLNEEEEAFLISSLRKVKVKKKQFIVQPGFPCQYRTFIVKGAFRSFLYDNNAHEHTVTLAVETWWISDFNSYINQTPATLFVEALEPSEVIQMSYESERLLLKKYPKFEKFFRILYQKALVSIQKRALHNLSKTAEERYKDFIDTYPDIAQRVPQYALASYLGFSKEYLSKIRNRKS